MSIGLGSLVGGIIGGVAGSFAGNPLAGFAVGSAVGGGLEEFITDDQGEIVNTGAEGLRNQQIALARKQQAQWEKVYGPIQEKLARNISNMTVDSVSALGLQSIEQQFEAAGVKVRERIAQRGLEGSGLDVALTARRDIAKAEAKAKVRSEAPAKIEAAQNRFLSLGLQTKNKESVESRLLGQQANASDIAFNRAEQNRRLDEANQSNLLSDTASTIGNILGESGIFDPKGKAADGKPVGKPTVSNTIPTEPLAPNAPIIRPNENLNDRLDTRFATTGVV